MLVLGDAHRPHQHGRARRPVQPGEASHVGTRRPGRQLELVERLAVELGDELVEAGRVRADELTIDGLLREQLLQDAVEERDVPAHVHAEELVGHLRAEQGALDVARHPVAVEAGLAKRVDDGDLRSPLPRQEQVLHEHGLRVGGVAADEHDEIGADDVAVRDGRRAGADRLLQHERRRRVTDPGGVVDVVATQEPDELLRDVVRLVGEPARREIHAEAVRPRGPEPVGDEVERVVPAHAPEAVLALVTHHRVREAAEVPELLPAQLAK